MVLVKPASIDLCRTRGDTTLFTLTITDGSGTAINITGYTITLTVDPSDEPSDATGNLFSLVATVTDGPNGVATFELSAAQADQVPGEYFYDIQMLDTSGRIRTITKGSWDVVQDITK